MRPRDSLRRSTCGVVSVLDVLEVESRPEVLVPEERQDGHHGQHDQRAREQLVGERAKGREGCKEGVPGGEAE